MTTTKCQMEPFYSKVAIGCHFIIQTSMVTPSYFKKITSSSNSKNECWLMCPRYQIQNSTTSTNCLVQCLSITFDLCQLCSTSSIKTIGSENIGLIFDCIPQSNFNRSIAFNLVLIRSIVDFVQLRLSG